jgi:CubicO group peptidase (beta-lactamase class C family)
MAGLSKPRLERMDRVMAGYVERGEVPGMVTVVGRRDEVHVNAVGALSLGGGPVRRDSIFRIASLTKPVTAAAAMILVEECRLRLDDPVDGLLPELANRRVLRRVDGPVDDTVPAARPLTLRDLLTLRMGLGYLMDAAGTYPIHHALAELGILQGPPHPQGMPAPDEWMRRVGSLPLMVQPGERWMYDIALDVAGVLVSRAAGQPLDVFLRERIFEPLGMRDTGFHVPPPEIHRFATSYTPDPATGGLAVYDEARGGDWSRPPPFPAGASGLVSTADDFLAFARMLLNGGALDGRRILSRPSVELMTADQLTAAQKAASPWPGDYFAANGWGFGVGVVTRRERLANVGTYGWDGGLGLSWRNDPREGLIGILLTQRAAESPAPSPLYQDFWTGSYQAIDD